jgi:hypothetical protein
MKKLLFFTLVFSIHVSANAQEAFSTLEERMSGKEFKETGLSRLTDEELVELNDWIRRHSVATLENASARSTAGGTAAGAAYVDSETDIRGFEHEKKFFGGKNDTIHSNIVGTFTGWSGNNTIFKLTNGMIWEQAEGETFVVKATENAAITIEKGMIGGWRLSMVGYNNKVRVNRIQ